MPSPRTSHRPTSVVPVIGVGHSGYLWLSKKTGKLKLRKTKTKLWFVFDVPTCKLMFSRSPQEAVAQPTSSNSLDLMDSTLMFGQEKNQFIISIQGREFHLSTESHGAMMKWLNVLQDCREVHRKRLDDLDIDMTASMVADDDASQDLVPGTLLDGESDPEDGAASPNNEARRTSMPILVQRDTTELTEIDGAGGMTIGSHASVVLDPLEFLSELNQHNTVATDNCIPEDEGEESGAQTGHENLATDLSFEGEAAPDVFSDIRREDAPWESSSEKGIASVSRSSVTSNASSTQPASSGDDVDADVAMVAVARGTVRQEERGADVLEADDALRFDEAPSQRMSQLTDSMQSFHSGYTMWEHFTCRKSEVGKHDLITLEDDEDIGGTGADFFPSQVAGTKHAEEIDRKDSKQVQSLKSSLSQLEGDLRMALNQITVLEGREVAYREKLANVGEEGPPSKGPQQVDSGPSSSRKQISLRRKRSASSAAPVPNNQQELDDLKMAADRYHEQNIVMTKEVVQLVEARRDEQRKNQQYTTQCKILSQDMVRLKISYVDVLMESYPVRLKCAPGDRWDDDNRMDPLEAKNQQRVYALLAECHRYDKIVPVFNRSFPGGKHTEDFGYIHTWDEYNVEMHYYLCNLLKRHYHRQLQDSVGQRQEKNWKSFLADNLWDMSKMAQRSNELKSLIINGIPVKQRASVWRSLIALRLKKYREAKGPDYYASLQGYQNSHSRQIQVDLHRTLTSHVDFVRGSESIAKLQRILLAYSIHNPLVGYCQGMNMLVAFGLLILQDEEEVFWFLVALVERYLPEHYFDRNLVGAQADQLMMKEMLEEKLPLLSQHLDFYGIDVAMVTFNWCLTVFVDAVPIETLLRIWDCLLFEGSRVLFRFSLAILQWHAPRLQRIHDPITLFQHLKLMAKLAYNEDELTKLAYISLHPFASRKHMAARREHFMAIKQAAIDEDDAARARDKHRREQAPVAFKSPMQRAANRPTDVSKRVTVWECAAMESADLLWLCEGDREAGYVSVLQLSTARASLVECDLQSRIMSICKLQERHMLLGTLLGTLTAFLSTTACELFTVQLKDSVLSLASMSNGKTFAGLADGTLVVFEKFTAQAISREVMIQSGISITSLLLVNGTELDVEATSSTTATSPDESCPETAEAVASADDSPTEAPMSTSSSSAATVEGQHDPEPLGQGADVPDCLGRVPDSLAAVDGRGTQNPVAEVPRPSAGTNTYRHSTLSTTGSLLGDGPMLWCGCGNKLLVLDAETLEEVTSIELSPNQRSNISHLRLTQHGVWTVMHRTATIDLWDKTTFKRLLSMDCAALLGQGFPSEDGGDALAAPVSQRATAFAIGEHSLWLGTANGYLIIGEIAKRAGPTAVTKSGDERGHDASGASNTGVASERSMYKLKLVGLHRVSEDALRVLVVSHIGDEEVAVHCPQHASPQLWRQQAPDASGRRVWKSSPVDCESMAIEDLLHLEKKHRLALSQGEEEQCAIKRKDSMDFLAEAEMIDRNEIILKPACVDQSESDEDEGEKDDAVQ